MPTRCPYAVRHTSGNRRHDRPLQCSVHFQWSEEAVHAFALLRFAGTSPATSSRSTPPPRPSRSSQRRAPVAEPVGRGVNVTPRTAGTRRGAMAERVTLLPVFRDAPPAHGRPPRTHPQSHRARGPFCWLSYCLTSTTTLATKAPARGQEPMLRGVRDELHADPRESAVALSPHAARYGTKGVGGWVARGRARREDQDQA